MIENYSKFVKIHDTFLLKNAIESFAFESSTEKTLMVIMKSGETHFFNEITIDLFEYFKKCLKIGNIAEII